MEGISVEMANSNRSRGNVAPLFYHIPVGYQIVPKSYESSDDTSQ